MFSSDSTEVPPLLGGPRLPSTSIKAAALWSSPQGLGLFPGLEDSSWSVVDSKCPNLGLEEARQACLSFPEAPQRLNPQQCGSATCTGTQGVRRHQDRLLWCGPGETQRLLWCSLGTF